MYLRRKCYNKFWRCPGWAGGGFRYPRRTRCYGGSLLVPGIRVKLGDLNGDHMPRDRWWMWKFHRCNSGCGVVTLPLVLRNVDPAWWRYQLLAAYWNWKRRK